MERELDPMAPGKVQTHWGETKGTVDGRKEGARQRSADVHFIWLSVWAKAAFVRGWGPLGRIRLSSKCLVKYQ